MAATALPSEAWPERVSCGDADDSFRQARLFEDPWRGYPSACSARAKFEATGYRTQASISQVMVGMNLWFLGALEVRATLALALALVAQGRAAEARAEAGLATYATAKACSYFRVGWLMLARAEAIAAAGDEAGARAAISETYARVLAIAARVEDERYRESFLLRAPENARTAALYRAWTGSSPSGPRPR